MRNIGIKLVTSLVTALLLAGCAEFSAVKSGVATHGAAVADAAISTAKWEVCTAVTVGALERELAGDPARIAGWMLFCGKKPGHPLSVPPEVPVIPQSGVVVPPRRFDL